MAGSKISLPEFAQNENASDNDENKSSHEDNEDIVEISSTLLETQVSHNSNKHEEKIKAGIDDDEVRFEE